MKKIDKAILAAAFIGAMAFVLVACGNGSASSESVESDVPEDVFAKTEVTSYQEDGKVLSKTTFELDDYGNAVQALTRIEATEQESVTKYEYDENGYITGITQPDGQKITYELTLDGDKLISSTGSNGFTTERKYHDNGMVSETVTKMGDEYQSVVSYDENGCEVGQSVTFGSGNAKKEVAVEYTWEFDESNTATSLTVELTKQAAGTSIGGLPAGTYNIWYDANDNIAKFVNAETEYPAIEYEYAYVDDPSAAVKYSDMITAF